MDITVTAHNKIPYLDSIPIVPTYVEEAVQSITTHLCNISVLPNPFSRKTIIHFSFSQNNQKTKIEIFDSIGRRVKDGPANPPVSTGNKELTRARCADRPSNSYIMIPFIPRDNGSVH